MKKLGYLVWVNDTQFWHASLGAAQKRCRQAEGKGKDTLIVGFEILPYVVGRGVSRSLA